MRLGWRLSASATAARRFLRPAERGIDHGPLHPAPSRAGLRILAHHETHSILVSAGHQVGQPEVARGRDRIVRGRGGWPGPPPVRRARVPRRCSTTRRISSGCRHRSGSAGSPSRTRLPPRQIADHPEDMAKRCMGGSILGIEFEATPDRRHRGCPRGVNIRAIMHCKRLQR